MKLKEKCCLLLGLVLICTACSHTNQESEIMDSRVVSFRNGEALVAITNDSSYMYFRKTTDTTLAVYASPVVEPSLYECFVKEFKNKNWNWDAVYQSQNFGFLSKPISIKIPKTVSWNGVDCLVTEIGDGAFFSCTGLTSISIPNSVTTVGNRAFADCERLTSIVIPNSVISIGKEAFDGCKRLTSIDIPNSMTSVSEGSFLRCPNIEQICVASDNAYYDSRENCNAIIEKASNKILLGCKNTIIPHSVTSIGDMAFSGCTGLTSIDIPNSVTSIGSEAFAGCEGLTSIDIPNAVTSIGWGAFRGCTRLTSITIPNSVTSIGNLAFAGCTNLASVDIMNPNTKASSLTAFDDDFIRKHLELDPSRGYSASTKNDSQAAYSEIMQLQDDVRELIYKAAQYRTRINSETYGSFHYQSARIEYGKAMGAAIEKQKRAIKIAKNKIHDETLVIKLGDQLELLEIEKRSEDAEYNRRGREFSRRGY